MNMFRDGITETIDGPVTVTHTREGHVVECYSVDGEPRFFVTLAGTHYCAHGATVADAVADALWKDPANRPSREALVAEIQEAGRHRLITVPEFRLLTGACAEGCRVAIARAKITETAMTAESIRDRIDKAWGDKLLRILGWAE